MKELSKKDMYRHKCEAVMKDLRIDAYPITTLVYLKNRSNQRASRAESDPVSSSDE